MSSGLAGSVPTRDNQMEIEKAVESILPKSSDTNTETNDNSTRKRSFAQLSIETNTENETQLSPKNKRMNQLRFYKPENKGPFEVIIQDKNKAKLNPFQIGKIIKTHHTDIDYIKRSGNNISVFCKSHDSANKLIQSELLTQYNVFIPSIRVYSNGVLYIDPCIGESEILTESECEHTIIEVIRIKKRINQELRDTHFVKVTFDSDKLPEYITLNYVRVKVEPYMIPVKQCYRCFAYGHVANSPCRNNRLCRDCGEPYHSNECLLPRKCVHCFGSHSSNSKFCPEYTRQKNIKERMSLNKEDYFTASQFFPITYKKIRGAPRRPQSFAEAAKLTDMTDSTQYPELPQSSSSRQIDLANRFSPLSMVNETPNDTRTYTTYRKPNTFSSNRSNSSKSLQTNQTSQKPFPAKIKPTAPPTKPNAPEATNINKDYYKTLLNAKLTEIRNKLKSSNVTSKKQMDDLIATFINSDPDNKNVINPNKMNTTQNKNSTPVPPDKK